MTEPTTAMLATPAQVVLVRRDLDLQQAWTRFDCRLGVLPGIAKESGPNMRRAAHGAPPFHAHHIPTASMHPRQDRLLFVAGACYPESLTSTCPRTPVLNLNASAIP